MSAPDTAHRPASAANETCPECGTRFACGALAGEESCWCREVPKVVAVPVTPEARCLCPACLGRRIASAG